jgi:hypothetical protein
MSMIVWVEKFVAKKPERQMVNVKQRRNVLVVKRHAGIKAIVSTNRSAKTAAVQMIVKCHANHKVIAPITRPVKMAAV